MVRVSRLSLLLAVFSFLTAFTVLYAQRGADDVRHKFAPINAAIPSLSTAPDVRGGAMGDNGVATTPDVSSQYWGPAKYAFSYSKAGVALSYTPWLRKLVNNAALAYLAGYHKLGDSDMQAIGASLRYFSLGEIQESRDGGMGNQLILNPYKVALDVSYSRKLSDVFSMAVALRCIHSDMGTSSDADMVPGDAFAADIAGYLEKYAILGNSECLWSFGFNVSNIGTKVSYDSGNTDQSLPMMLKVGTGLLYPIDDYNQIGIYVGLNKYLVPTKPIQEGTTPEDEVTYKEEYDEYNNISPITGIFKSFGDSLNGFKDELKEIMASIGLEYNYNQQFFVRGDYYYENKYQGNRQYFSVGAGFRVSVFQLGAAYLISTVQSNPLDQTSRFPLSFDTDGIKSLFRQMGMKIHVGSGCDVHALVPDRELWLDGIKIEYTLGLLGHSDADVPIHVICNASLGVANMRDTGYHFPDMAGEYRNIDSKILLRDTMKLLREAGYESGNIDATIAAERPKLNPHTPLMKKTLAEVMNVDEEDVSIKVTTTEKLGFTGRQEGIPAYATVLI